MVHDLVAKIFHPHDDYTGLTVDHINGVRDDNHVSNLRWATAKERTDNRKRLLSEYNRVINQYDINGNFIARWESLEVAAKTGLATESTIVKICKEKYGSYNGYTWRYADEVPIVNEIITNKSESLSNVINSQTNISPI